MDEKQLIAPADGTDAEDAIKLALFRKAMGYDVEEVTIIDSEKMGHQEIRKTKHIPGDVKAMEQYVRKYGDSI